MDRGRLTVSLFAEDVGHERFLRALVRRLAREENVEVRMQIVSAKGGHGKVLEELKLFQRVDMPGRGELLIVAIDANCKGLTQARSEIEQIIDRMRFPEFALACPDPHVERWYMADPQGLRRALGAKVNPGKVKCERDRYKQMLLSALRDAGQVILLGGSEFADEIVDAMDLYQAGKNEPSLRHFVSDLKKTLSARR